MSTTTDAPEGTPQEGTPQEARFAGAGAGAGAGKGERPGAGPGAKARVYVTRLGWLPLPLRQLVKFGIVGAAGIVVNMAVAILLNTLNGGPENAQQILFPIPGTTFNVRFTVFVWVAAFLVANLFNFQFNRVWTFRDTGPGRWWSEFWRFLLVGSVAAVVGIVVKIALTNPRLPLYLPDSLFYDEFGWRSREYWAQFITILVTMPVNFLVNKYWTFRRAS